MKYGFKMFGLAVLLVVTGVAITHSTEPENQAGRKKRGNGQACLADLVAELNVPDEPKAKAREIVAACEDQRRALVKQMQEAERKLDDDVLRELKAVLPPEQFQNVKEAFEPGAPAPEQVKREPPAKKKAMPQQKKGEAARQMPARQMPDGDRLAKQINAEVKATVRQILGKHADGKCAD